MTRTESDIVAIRQRIAFYEEQIHELTSRLEADKRWLEGLESALKGV